MMTIDWTHAWLGDVPALIDRGGADAERIGAAGVSMGACIVYGAIARERRLRAAVALLGSPARGRPDGSRLAVDRFFPSALLSVTAGADVVVPPAAAASLHAELTDWYRNDPDRLCHQSFPDAEQPGAKKSEIAGLHGDALKILLAAPPVDGKANEALMKFVAGTLGIAKSEVTQKRPGLDHHSGQG